MIIIFAIIASLAAFLGGFIALKFRDKLHLILGFSAGTVVGAALFDLIPEAIELSEGVYEIGTMTALVALGFLLYLILDRVFSFHIHEDDEISAQSHHLQGSIRAASFCLHSIIDGIAIGLAFQASSAIGIIVAIAVIAHRFSDGINTIGVILKHRGGTTQAWGWLTAVIIAPVVGAFATRFVSIEDSSLALILAVFAGFFLYIGASDLIPEGHHSHSKILTTIMTLVGAGVLFLIIQFAHI